jgi:CsoR family transcriptional regulator, copper-sensing transcriptional repressor
MARNKKHHSGASVDHKKQLPRLRRIEGQVRGLQQMVEQERYCVDVAHQINAVIAALRRVQGDMIRDHLAVCAEAALSGDLSGDERRQLADEIGSLMAKST